MMIRFKKIDYFILTFLISSYNCVAQSGLLNKQWTLVMVRDLDYLEAPLRLNTFGSDVDAYEGLSIESKLIETKKTNFSSTVLDIKSDGRIDVINRGFVYPTTWKLNGNELRIGTERYELLRLTQNELILKEKNQGLSTNEQSLYLSTDYLDLLSNKDIDQFFALDDIDSLIIQKVNDKSRFRIRTDLTKDPDQSPSYSEGEWKITGALKETFGEQMVGSDYAGSTGFIYFSFVVEKNGTISHLATDVTSRSAYEKIHDAFDSLNGFWHPGRKDGKIVASLVQFKIILKN